MILLETLAIYITSFRDPICTLCWVSYASGGKYANHPGHQDKTWKDEAVTCYNSINHELNGH